MDTTGRAYRAGREGTNNTGVRQEPHERIAGFAAFVNEADTRARLVRVAERIVSRDDAEDAAHDGIVQALQSASAFRREAQLSTWMHQVVVNAALMRLRKRKRQLRQAAAVAQEAPVAPWLVSSEVAPSPATVLEEREALHLMRGAVQGLDETYRRAIESCVLQERAPEDVAAELGVSPSALRTRLGRGRRQLVSAMAGLRA